MIKRRLLFLAMACLPAGLAAADWKEIEGLYLIGGISYLDPDPSEAQDTHLWLQLHGSNAEALYHALKVEPVEDACTGGLKKTVGEMGCIRFPAVSEGPERYECSFSIDLRDQRIGRGVAC